MQNRLSFVCNFQLLIIANNVCKIEPPSPHTTSLVSGNGDDGYGDDCAAASGVAKFSFPSLVSVDTAMLFILLMKEIQ
jgi:hypothetical protein